MKHERLRDGGATDPTWSAIERLCRSQPPTQPDLAMQARVLQRLERPRRNAARLRLRPAFVALCVLFFAATASALWGTAHRWRGDARRALTAPAPLPERQPETRTPSSAPAPPAVRAVPPPSRVQRRAQIAVSERVAHSAEVRPIDAPPPSRPAPLLDPQESLLVHAAVRALRVDGRTGRARALLSEYLSRFPHGALAEDAVALQIEAAMAERDSTAARVWAKRYVNEFPSGRFHAVADSVLREDSSKESSGSRP